MEISQILKEKRTEQQLTQEQLAEKVFVSKKQYQIGKLGKPYLILKASSDYQTYLIYR